MGLKHLNGSIRYGVTTIYVVILMMWRACMTNGLKHLNGSIRYDVT